MPRKKVEKEENKVILEEQTIKSIVSIDHLVEEGVIENIEIPSLGEVVENGD